MNTEKGNTSSKGFAGLNSLVSDVEIAEQAARQPSEARQPTSAKTVPQASTTEEAGRSQATSFYRGDASKTNGGKGKYWLIGIALFFLYIWIADSGTKSPSISAASAEEEIPPIGSGRVFNNGQIRYCLSEKIRIEAWDGAVNAYSQASVDAFNGAVNDYNARCSNFQYRQGALQRISSEVEASRYGLQQEGLGRASLNP